MTHQIRETLLDRGEPRPIEAVPLTGCEHVVPRDEYPVTACWRGYHGTWEIRDDRLHLVRLVRPFREPPDNDIFGRTFLGATTPVFAEWFSGLIPTGDRDRGDLDLVILRGALLLETRAEGSERRVRLTPYARAVVGAEEWPFLAGIQGVLADPVPQAVYADWLEERGDPRASLLRSPPAHVVRRDGSPLIDDGFVAAEDPLWFWRALAGIPAPVPAR